MQKIPYMLILGDKEVEANAVGVRSRKRWRHWSNEHRKFHE